MIFASAVVSSPNMCSLTSSGLLSNLMSGSFQGGSSAACDCAPAARVITTGWLLRMGLGASGSICALSWLKGSCCWWAPCTASLCSWHEANLVFVQVDVVERVICCAVKVVLELDQ